MTLVISLILLLILGEGRFVLAPKGHPKSKSLIFCRLIREHMAFSMGLYRRKEHPVCVGPTLYALCSRHGASFG